MKPIFPLIIVAAYAAVPFVGASAQSTKAVDPAPKVMKDREKSGNKAADPHAAHKKADPHAGHKMAGKGGHAKMDHKPIEVPSTLPVPTVSMMVTADTMDGYNLRLSVRNFRFMPAGVGGPARHGEGHAHLFINGKKIGRLYGAWRHLPKRLFRQGLNKVRVTLNANNHSDLTAGGVPIQAVAMLNTDVKKGSALAKVKVTWILSWLWGEAKPLPNAKGWQIDTSLGYQVRVTGGFLVTRSLELRGCHGQKADAEGVIRKLLGIHRARAGHGSLGSDKSKISKPIVESLINPRIRNVESRWVTTPEYCRVHWLTARLKQGRAPADIPNASVASVEVSGSFRRKGDTKWRPFTLSTNAAYGRFIDLKKKLTIAGATAGQPANKTYTVIITRRLDQLVDKVDFERFRSDDPAYALLRSVSEGATVTIGASK